MRIGIDARLWSESGVGRYIRNLVFSLSKIDKDNEYFLFFLKKNLGQKLPKNFTEVEANFNWYGVSEQIKFPKLLKKYHLDLVHFPHFNVPIFYAGKYVVTIHDLIHQHHKMKRVTTLNPLIYQIKHFAYTKAFKTALKKSQAVITVSNFVKGQLVDEMKISAKKITVTQEAVEKDLVDLTKKVSESDIKKTLVKFNIKPPFIFYVGNAHPHKNVEGLIKTFLEVRKNFQYLQLVLSGNDHYFWQRIKKEFQHKDIIYTGFVSEKELVALYKSAQCYVCPSFEEGFGIPLLEAMACGCPVVSSNAASLPEVGADAAIYFDPRNISDMNEKISQILTNQQSRKQLIEKGFNRYKQFNWEMLAKQTLGVYKTCE